MSDQARLGSAPSALEWRSVTLRLGGFSLSDISLSIPAGHWTCLSGPPGAGKSVLLEIAAGFHRPGFGRVFRNGTDVTEFAAEERKIAFVPEDSLLFPHLDVRGNLLFGQPPKMTRRVRNQQLARVVTGLGITHLLDQEHAALSDGERQRISVGRAILSGQRLLLVDEPAGLVDEESRRLIDTFLLTEKNTRGLTLVQVNTDLVAAHRMADLVVGLNEGQIEKRSGAAEAASMSRIVPFPLDRN